MVAVPGAFDVGVDADFVEGGDDVFDFGEVVEVVVDDDGEGDVVFEVVAAGGDDGLVCGGCECAVAGELLFFLVHFLFPAVFGFGWVGAASADDVGCEGGVLALGEAGDTGSALSFADAGDGVAFACHFVAAVGLALVGVGDFEGFLDDVGSVGGGEDLRQGDLFFDGAVEAVDVDFAHGRFTLLVCY